MRATISLNLNTSSSDESDDKSNLNHKKTGGKMMRAADVEREGDEKTTEHVTWYVADTRYQIPDTGVM
jgi:hypothetical protein